MRGETWVDGYIHRAKKLQLCRLDKAGAHVIIKIERDAATAVRTLVKYRFLVDDRSGSNPSGHRAFIQKMYSRMTTHIKS